MKWIVIAGAFVIIDLVVGIAIVGALVRGVWGPLARDRPPHPPSADAVTRRFQSFRFGLVSFGWSIHVAADEAYLHLAPVRFMQLLGCKPVSIPWDEMSIVKRSKKGRWITARVGTGILMEGPGWCLELAPSMETDRV